MTYAHPHDERRRQAVGWALHALEPDEYADFALHLADCADCHATVDETLETLGGLGRAVEQEDPPPRLRQSILARALEEIPEEEEGPGASSGTSPVTSGLDGSSVSGSSSGDTASSRPSRPAVAPRHSADGAGLHRSHSGPDHTGRSSGPPLDDAAPPARDEAPGADVPALRRRRRTVRLLAAAAAVVVIAAVGGLVAVNQSLRDQRDAQAAATAESQQVLQVVRDAGTPGAQRATLATTSGQLVGLVVDVGRGPEVLTTGLPGNRSDQTYVLWGLAGSTPVPLGAFDVPGSGASARSVPSPGEAGRYAGYAVSLEPGRTVPASPTEVVASGQVGR